MNKSTLEAEFDRIWIEVMADAPVEKGALKMVQPRHCVVDKIR